MIAVAVSRPGPTLQIGFPRLRLHRKFDEAFASTQLPDRPDYAWANEFLLKGEEGKSVSRA
jgi:hypothetical protein